MSGRTVGWMLLALAGLAVAVALSLAASNLSTQPIGLSGEELRAGDRLAPAPARTTSKPAERPKRRKRSPTQTTTATSTTPTPTTTTGVEPGDDHGGRRGGGGGGHGSDD